MRLVPLDEAHDLDAFDCRHDEGMNAWLKTQAMGNQKRDLSRVFVLVCANGVVRAFFAISSHFIQKHQVTAKDRRSFNEDLRPAQLLGRFATDNSVKGGDVGVMLMDLVFEKYLEIIERTTCGYLCLDAKNPWLVQYYAENFGFKAPGGVPSESGSTFMYLKTSAIQQRFLQPAEEREESA
ncbi:hypothetical protein [Arthrobacter sp. EpRS71]|uniref:hypothetical protein n=1 Tax=Arthrobacter sp. EpRS71 TaxID=1743141 RepID=UPI000747901C|nr:hypothetical protein [Arthrobacter sp. EpRS71]KUM34586.1 hypothetical protein AR689_10620 [Arthrobacter sp. EpRS71]